MGDKAEKTHREAAESGWWNRRLNKKGTGHLRVLALGARHGHVCPGQGGPELVAGSCDCCLCCEGDIRRTLKRCSMLHKHIELFRDDHIKGSSSQQACGHSSCMH